MLLFIFSVHSILSKPCKYKVNDQLLAHVLKAYPPMTSYSSYSPFTKTLIYYTIYTHIDKRDNSVLQPSIKLFLPSVKFLTFQLIIRIYLPKQYLSRKNLL